MNGETKLVMAECLLAEGSPDYVEHLSTSFFDLRVGGHHEIIGVHGRFLHEKFPVPCHADIGSVPERVMSIIFEWIFRPSGPNTTFTPGIPASA